MEETKGRPAVQSQDRSGAQVNQRGVWRRFFHTCKAANLPYGFLLFYILLTVAEGFILVRIPQVNSNFFAGDVSVGSVSMFIGMELVSMVVTQSILFVNHVVRYRTNRNLRSALWGKILRLKPAYFDRVSASTLISRITVDSDSINEFVLDVVLEAAAQIYYLTITIAAMSAISIRAGLTLLAFVPVSIAMAFVIGRLNLKFQNTAKFRMANLTEYLSELIACLPLLKAFNMQGYESRRGRRVIDDYYRANRSLIGLDVVGQVVGSAVGVLPEIVIILMGIHMLQNSTVDAAGWYTFYLYAGTFIGFFNTLAGIWERSKSVQGQLNKVSDVLYEEEECVEDYVQEIVAEGDIMFEHVTFAYETDPVLRDATLTIPGKGITALIGFSGSGKTTITKLLERIYEPDEGRILSGGGDIAAYGIRDWREKIAYVMQETPLLSGTIRDNLLYGIRREVTEAEIQEAVKQANLDGFLAQLPEGLDYEVGQFGTRLSGGQRQKIAIAGAVLSGAPILILDEPTASLDVTSTDEIIRTVVSLRGRRTVILVTHDREAVRAADHIVLVQHDHTVVEGDGAAMARMSGFYRQLMEQGGGEV